MLSRVNRNHFGRALVAVGFAGLLASSLQAQDISANVQLQIGAIMSAKSAFTDAQNKIDSNLVFAAMAARGEPGVATFSTLIPPAGTDNVGTVTVDIQGNVTPSLLAAVAAAGGTILDQSAVWGMIHASIPLGSIEDVAANADVSSIRSAARMRFNGAPVRRQSRPGATPSSILARAGIHPAGALTSQGYITHAVNTVVNTQGINGTGVTVGVLSDSASAARIAALIATGDLPAGTSVLPGQDGPSIAAGGTDEGTAMMEIIHDMAPGANLIFATAFTSEISFANNIIALQAAGCKVIVDDVSYFDEGAFQDGPIARAVNQVTAAGVVYLSSAANSGNLTFGTSGTWEGDFVSGGAVAGVIAAHGETGLVHNFRSVASPQLFDQLTVATPFVQLKWSDPLGGSTNDYDLFVTDSTGATLKAFSTTRQNGTQDPYELVFLSNGTTNFAVGDRVVVVQFTGATRALRVDTIGGRLSIATSGATYGHNAGLNTVSTAATYWNSAKTGTRPFTGPANPIEIFSSDGPRKIFYNPDGSAITPGNFLFGTNGGVTLQKPDLTAADGNSAKTPGFNPFFGTSAAAPHAAGIAALVLQVRPAYTPAQVKAAMLNATLDNMAAGIDRDSGYGIVMATLAVQYALAH